MSDDKYDFDLPDLPSDEELGISEEDYALLDEQGEIKPEPPPGAAPKSTDARPGPSANAAEERSTRKGRAQKPRKPKKPKRPSWLARRRARKAAAAASGSPAASDPSTTGRGGDGGTGATATDGRPEAPEAKDGPAGRAARVLSPLTLALLVMIGWASTMNRSRPSPRPANAPDTVFSSARAMTDLVEIAKLPHPTGSPEHARVLSYLTARLEALDLEPEVQTTTAVVRIGEELRSATVRNLMARITGSESTGAVLLVSHYDSRSQSRGAADAGVGVVTILEAVRAVQLGTPPRNDVIVLLTDAEEVALLGAKAFADQHPWMDDVAVVVNIEMRGAGGASIMFETGSENGWVVRALQAATPHATANSMSEEVYRRLPNRTDFTVFRAAGKQGLNFATVGRPAYYHQRFDSPENVDEATVQHHGEQVLSVLEILSQADLRAMEAPDAVFFRVPFVGLVVYGDRWVIPLGMFLVIMAIGVYAIGRTRGLRARGVLAGLSLSVVATAAAAGLGSWLYGWVTPFHPEFGSLQAGAFHREGLYVLGLLAASFAIVMLLLPLARRWFSIAELALGAALPALAAALAMTVWTPGAAMNLQWPVFAALLAAAILALRRGDAPGPATAIIAIVLAAPVSVFLVFMFEGLWLSMSFSLAPVLGGLIVAGLMLILPALDVVRRLNWWWSPLLGAVAAVALVGVGIVQARPAPDRPAPSTLLYALDRETGAARWVTSRDSTPAHPGVAWVAERTSGFDESGGLEAFHLRANLDPKWAEETYRLAEAEPILAPVPTVSIVSDSTEGGERVVTVAITSGVVAERLVVSAPEFAVLTAVNGRAPPEHDAGGEPVTTRAVRLAHWGATDGGLRLSFAVPIGAASIELELVEHLLRPHELLGDEVFRRPPGLTPDIRRFSDRVMIRTPVRVQLGESGGVMVVPPPGEASTASGGVGSVVDGLDTGGLPGDSAGAPADQVPDTAGGPVADTTGDPAGAAPDSGQAQPDTAGAAPDSGQGQPDTPGAAQDTTPPVDSTGAAPDSSGVSFGSGNAVPRPAPH